jgi:two-component system chemotaxis response regulator CheY
VILTDLNMPKMDGVELMRRLEQDAVLKTIPVLVVSTDRTDRRVHQMLGLGAKGYVKKPFAAETLREELELVLEVNHDGG